MSRVTTSTCAILAVGGLVAGCQTAPVQYASDGVHATYTVAATGAGAVRATGGELYLGAGSALRAPLHDLNMMQDKIAPVLLRAEAHPYDLTGVNSCSDVLDRVAELDLALGPDVDTPKQGNRTRVARGADFAASTALDAAGSAAEHFIPMRGTIKQLTGAQRYENHVKHASLAGTTRRSFLKAIGMEHNCAWPAAPLDFHPTQVAEVSAAWNAVPATSSGQSGGAPIRLASAHASAPLVAAPVTLATTTSAAAPIRTAEAAPSHAITPVSVPIYSRLVLPAAVAPADPAQTWRRPSTPLSSQASLVEVSASVTNASVTSTPLSNASMSNASMSNAAVASSAAAAPPPWSAAFSATSARP